MIFGQDLLFIHVPKTGGASTTVYLMNVLPKPIFLSQPIRDPGITDPGIVQIPGIRHESLAEARDVVAGHGFALDRFPLILATFRNPYQIELSRYAYLRQGHPWQRGPEQELALAGGFAEFAVANRECGGPWPTSDPSSGATPGFAERHRRRPAYPTRLQDFFTLDGRFPDNLRILRFERLVADLTEALRGIGIGDARPFPWINRSRHGDYRAAYTPRAEDSVYRRYRWAFDQGFYPRLTNAGPEPPAPVPVLDHAPR